MLFSNALLGALISASGSCTFIGSEYGPPPPATNADVVLVTGISNRTPGGQVKIRREIRELKNKSPEQWNLYLLGLRSFQMTDQTDPLSWYEIAGIHGKPFKVWQGALGIGGRVGNYCPHQNRMFLGWHRPYLALFEQELYKHIRTIASLYPPDLVENYTSAAEEFRIPYWDWALGPKGGTLPELFVMPTIQVIATNGVMQTIPNPLYRYEFHPLIPGDFDGKWAHINATVRWPTSDLPSAPSQNELVMRDYASRSRSYLDKLSKIFAHQTTMNNFSTALEELHGWIHYNIAGAPDTDRIHPKKFAGHMLPTEYSAFDPIFWLHHCNVDRLFALWQAAHPGNYFGPSVVGLDQDNMWIDVGSTVDANTSLPPFWQTPTSFWTTNSVKDTQVLGYAYPETQRWLYDDEIEYGSAVNASIANLYSSSVRAMLTSGPDVAGAHLSHLLVDNSFVDWDVQIQGDRRHLPSTFLLRFFLVGDFSSDPVTDVGGWAVLMPGSRVQREKMARRATTHHQDMKGVVSLTATLIDDIAAGKLESLDARYVVPYLKDRLTWKPQAGDGTIVPHKDLRGLVIQVTSTVVRIPDDPNLLMEYGDSSTAYPEVTLGKSGGIQR